MTLDAIAKTLNRDEVRSQVMKDGAYFDSFVGIALGMYFSRRECWIEFNDLIMDRLTFDEKLRAMEKLPLKKSYKALAALPVIRHLQQVRNVIAHEWYIDARHPKLRNANWTYLFFDYPKSYEKPVGLARQRLRRLSGSKEFLGAMERKK